MLAELMRIETFLHDLTETMAQATHDFLMLCASHKTGWSYAELRTWWGKREWWVARRLEYIEGECNREDVPETVLHFWQEQRGRFREQLDLVQDSLVRLDEDFRI